MWLLPNIHMQIGRVTMTSVFREQLIWSWCGSSAVLSLSDSDLELLSESLELADSTPLDCAASNELLHKHTRHHEKVTVVWWQNETHTVMHLHLMKLVLVLVLWFTVHQFCEFVKFEKQIFRPTVLVIIETKIPTFQFVKYEDSTDNVLF